MASRYRIHPAIGTARMGNSPDGFFLGPETPGALPNFDAATGKFKSFRDAKGNVLRQGAQFRVFEYPDGGAAPREATVGGDFVDIEWRVHIANRKSSFYVFLGQFGADDTYIKRSRLPPTAIISVEGDEPKRTNLRNADVPAAQRIEQLDIDPGEQLISQKRPGPVELKNTKKHIPIESLGTLRLGDKGRLIVLGGYGESNSTDKPPRPIDEYASNDTWFDDSGDGSVKARIRFKDGSTVDADPAWVFIGPPKFAPGIGNVVTLFDCIWDIGVRDVDVPALTPKTPATLRLLEQKKIWQANGGKSLRGYKPSFVGDILPMLRHAHAACDLHIPYLGQQQFHAVTLGDFGKLSASGKDNDELREYVFNYMRDPDSAVVQWNKMPRGLGDNYTAMIVDQFEPTPNSLFSVTRIQYAMLREWAAGNFINDWPGTLPQPVPKADPTPDELDRAALENSVGGPFFPGIEVSWLIRVKEVYSEPFRFKLLRIPEDEQKPNALKVGALEFGPGFFSQQMALPWQADFYECHKEQHDDTDGNAYYYMWWTAQRPDDTYPSGKKTQERWTRSLNVGDDDDERFNRMQESWDTLKFVTVTNGGRYEEEP
jgi:L-Lysine epsilon oxidase N-terminal/L-lysine epsilon oxidase C-terminal domain